MLNRNVRITTQSAYVQTHVKSLVEPGAKVTVIVFTEETWWPSSNTLSECYNNVDVGVPLWLTEPRDKHPR